MREQEPITPTTCNHCGKAFNTSQVHPRRYCSIACEEGRAPRAQSDPAAEDYWLHLQGEPETLVGKDVVAGGRKWSDYSPDWHRKPGSYSNRMLVDYDSDEQWLIIESHMLLGTVVAYDSNNGEYLIENENLETGETFGHWHDAGMVVDQIRRDRWWVEG